MLTKRTNLLLEESDHQLLQRLSRQQRKTIGALIRHAVKTTYTNPNTNVRHKTFTHNQQVWTKMKDIISQIKSKKLQPLTPKEIKAMTHEGHRY